MWSQQRVALTVVVYLGLASASSMAEHPPDKVESSGGTKVEIGRDASMAARALPDAVTAAARRGGRPAVTAVHDVGIIPGSGGCPPGSERIQIFMDDEDNKNANGRSGWTGAIHQDHNTTFVFCRVDGALFSDVIPGPFAVLQLGETCPAGSQSFARLFENERKNNINGASSSFGYGIAPNVSIDNYTQLNFCQFNGKAPPLHLGPLWNFPDFGVEYGVFASRDLAGAPAYGSIHTDDEDGNAFSHNRNDYSYLYYTSAAMQRIVSGTTNTDLALARVMPYCQPVAGQKINGQSATQVTITGPDWPIVVDGSPSSCADSYFVAIQLSDAAWNRYGGEAMRWLTAADYARYGPIHQFDMKKFAEDQWVIFVPGQYYRVKLAVGPTWNETTTLIYIAEGDPLTSGATPRLQVLGHVQSVGDVLGAEKQWVGGMGSSRRLEGFQVKFLQPVPGLGLEYMAHLQGIGDTPFVPDGHYVGTRGQARRVEGFAIRLTGANAPQFDVFYQCHMAGIGDSPIVKGPAFCGTRGQSRRVEGLKVWVVKK